MAAKAPIPGRGVHLQRKFFFGSIPDRFANQTGVVHIVSQDMQEDDGDGKLAGGNTAVIQAVEEFRLGLGLELHVGAWGLPPGIGNAAVILD